MPIKDEIARHDGGDDRGGVADELGEDASDKLAAFERLRVGFDESSPFVRVVLALALAAGL